MIIIIITIITIIMIIIIIIIIITIIIISFYIKYPVSTIQTPSNSNNNKLLLQFGGLWKVKANYIVLNLNALSKFWNAKGVLKS